MAAPRLDPEAWTPPKAPPLEGPYARNEALAAAELWLVPEGEGPEDVAVDSAGCVYAGVADGRILRWPAGGGDPAVVADTGGRPLGIEVDRDGSLVVCDANKGLLRVRDGSVEVLVDAFEGRPLLFTNNADIASDGTIYFTDSSTRFGIDQYRHEIFESRPNGRLLAHDPATGETRLVADGLYFANGVALVPGEEHALVAETSRYRILRVRLSDGHTEPFIENLPGFPDNLSRGSRGRVWVAIATPRLAVADRIMPRPGVRKLVAWLPEWTQPQPKDHAFVIAVDERGEVVAKLQDPSGRYYYTTGMREHDGWLYVGSLTHPAVARVRLDAPG
jgi:sugar lactone lactonase YvrE